MKRSRLTAVMAGTAALAMFGLTIPATAEPTPTPTPVESTSAPAADPIAPTPEPSVPASTEHQTPPQNSPASEPAPSPEPSSTVTTLETESPIDLFAAANPWIGTPIGEEADTPQDGRMRAYEKATVYWSQATGAHAVSGDIREAWLDQDGPSSFFGFPTGPERQAPGGGRSQNFQRGTIYWTSTTGAYGVSGAIAQGWRNLGGPSSFYGYPTSNEISLGGGAVYQTFQRGTYYWSSASGAWMVQGGIAGAYQRLGGPHGFFGFPTGPERQAPGGGISQNFQRGTIYWTSTTGAYGVSGAIAQIWRNQGGPAGSFGYPTSNEITTRDGAVYQNFQRGTYFWSRAGGVQTVQGAIGSHWRNQGGEWGRFGLPISREFCNNAGCYQNFQYGSITWGPTTGAHDLYKLDARCTYGRVVCADKTTNKMYWVVNGQILGTFDARFGAPGWETTNGEMTIFRKEAMSWSVPFSAWMPWSQYFTSSGMAIHYSSSFEADGFPSWGSHGCINMNNYGQAEWLFNQTRHGDRIVVYWS